MTESHVKAGDIVVTRGGFVGVVRSVSSVVAAVSKVDVAVAEVVVDGGQYLTYPIDRLRPSPASTLVWRRVRTGVVATPEEWRDVSSGSASEAVSLREATRVESSAGTGVVAEVEASVAVLGGSAVTVETWSEAGGAEARGSRRLRQFIVAGSLVEAVAEGRRRAEMAIARLTVSGEWRAVGGESDGSA